MSPAWTKRTPTSPKLVLDPELADALTRDIRTMTPAELNSMPTRLRESPWWGAWAPAKCGAKICAAGFVLHLLAPGTWEGLEPLLHQFVWPGLSVLLLWAGGSVLDRWTQRETYREILGQRDHYILAEDLEPDARELIVRVQTAIRTVTCSVLHREGLIDGQRSAQLLPAQEWEIAVSLRSYSRLARKTPKSAKGERAQAVLAERRRLLRESRRGIEQQVTALETYAEQITKAEALHTEAEQVKQIGDSDSELLDLLARTVRHELGAEDTAALTSEVAVVVTAYETALDSAKEAAAIALPAPAPAE
jgi:hypothetical protein